MSKILIVYYSLTGNTKFIAETIQKAINADLLELKPEKELNADSSSKFVWGGYQSSMKKKPKLKEFDIDPLEYDLIILGTPVWAWRFSPPIRSFLAEFDFTGKNIALWMCSAGDGVKAMERFNEALKTANILGNLNLQAPLQHGPEEAQEKAINWAKGLITNLNSNQ